MENTLIGDSSSNGGKKRANTITFYIFGIFSIAVLVAVPILALSFIPESQISKEGVASVSPGLEYPLWEFQNLSLHPSILFSILYILLILFCLFVIAVFVFMSKKIVTGVIFGGLSLAIGLTGFLVVSNTVAKEAQKDNESIAQNFQQWSKARYDFTLPDRDAKEIVSKSVTQFDSGKKTLGEYTYDGKPVIAESEHGTVRLMQKDGTEYPITEEATAEMLYGIR